MRCACVRITGCGTCAIGCPACAEGAAPSWQKDTSRWEFEPPPEQTVKSWWKVSPDRKTGDGERDCREHLVSSGSQIFILSSPLRSSFLLSRSPIPNKIKQGPFDLHLVEFHFPHKQSCRDCEMKHDWYE